MVRPEGRTLADEALPRSWAARSSTVRPPIRGDMPPSTNGIKIMLNLPPSAGSAGVHVIRDAPVVRQEALRADMRP